MYFSFFSSFFLKFALPKKRKKNQHPTIILIGLVLCICCRRHGIHKSVLWKRPSFQDGAACSCGEDLPSCLIYLFCGPRSCGCGGCCLSLAEKYLYDMQDNKMISGVCKSEPKSRQNQPATAAHCLGKLGVSRLGTAFLLCVASVCRAPSPHPLLPSTALESFPLLLQKASTLPPIVFLLLLPLRSRECKSGNDFEQKAPSKSCAVQGEGRAGSPGRCMSPLLRGKRFPDQEIGCFPLTPLDRAALGSVLGTVLSHPSCPCNGNGCPVCENRSKMNELQ